MASMAHYIGAVPHLDQPLQGLVLVADAGLPVPAGLFPSIFLKLEGVKPQFVCQDTFLP